MFKNIEKNIKQAVVYELQLAHSIRNLKLRESALNYIEKNLVEDSNNNGIYRQKLVSKSDNKIGNNLERLLKSKN